MLMSGKMSVGVRSSATGANRTTTSAITMNVYGLRRDSRTIHINQSCVFPSEGCRRTPDRRAACSVPCLAVYLDLDSPQEVFGYAFAQTEIAPRSFPAWPDSLPAGSDSRRGAGS